MSRVQAVLLLAGPPKRLEDICQKQQVCPAVQVAVITKGLAPRPFAHGRSPLHWYAHQWACCRRPPSGGVWARWIDPRCPCTRKGTHPCATRPLVFLCRARIGLLSGRPLAGSPQTACQGRLAGIGRCQWSAVARGRRRYTTPCCWGYSWPCPPTSRWPASAGGSHSPVGCGTPRGWWWSGGSAAAWGCRRYGPPLDICL